MIEIDEDGMINIGLDADLDSLCAFAMEAVSGVFMKQFLPMVLERITEESGENAANNFIETLHNIQNNAINDIRSGPVIGPFDYGVPQ